MNFTTIKPGIVSLPAKWWYRALLNRSSSAFSQGSAPLQPTTADPDYSSGFTLVSSKSVSISPTTIERTLVLENVVPPAAHNINFSRARGTGAGPTCLAPPLRFEPAPLYPADRSVRLCGSLSRSRLLQTTALLPATVSCLLYIGMLVCSPDRRRQSGLLCTRIGVISPVTKYFSPADADVKVWFGK